ncbi:MAG TPA: exopolysaccharide biosynthesis protein [Steroidobacteraceae bacterium]|nr:exopolysaccharide biosynthesis protein [Steroidobacteraceae bacterium]
MTGIRFRNPEVRMSAALAGAATAVRDPTVSLRELLAALGEQGLLVFCGVLAAPFLLPVTVPGMSTVLGLPMLLIGFAVMVSRVPWLPERLLNHSLPSATVRSVLNKVRGWAERFEHLVRPRWLGLTGGRAVNALNGALVIVAVLLLMAPIPLVPLVNSIPALAVLLLCFGMAERDGLVIAIGYFTTFVAAVYVGGLIFLLFYVGLRHEQALEQLKLWFN